MKKFVIGDMHGAYKALMQCLERSKFDYDKDKLVVLGDVCDGYPDVIECFDELLKVKRLIYIWGNHDKWAYDFYMGVTGGIAQKIWLSQGGKATFDAYAKIGGMPAAHLQILKDAHVALEEKVSGVVRLYVHGGIDPNKKLEKQDPELCMWDRRLLNSAREKHYQKREDYKFGGYDEIFIGHTTTEAVGNTILPTHFCNVWNLDTGAGWSGKLTIMNVETKEYWQSNLTSDLYRGIQGRS
jgi:serine/threonine protein phosphatase 1